MDNDQKLDRLCKEFVSLDAREKDYILGISKALDFSVQQQGLSSGNRALSFHDQGEEPNGKAAKQ